MGDVSEKSNSKDNSLISMWSDKSLKDDLKKDNYGKGFGGMGAGAGGKEKGPGKSAKWKEFQHNMTTHQRRDLS